MQNLKITIVQSNIIWENASANIEEYAKAIEGITETDVIVLPEMFTTGFTMNSERLKEKMHGSTVEWMKNIARLKHTAILGSIIIQENEKIYNRAIWVFPDGKIKKYDKRHLYTMGREHLHYTQGKEKTIVEYKGWKFCLQICYDLRFPAFARNLEDYDVLIFMANWPSPRHHVWKNLLISRAIENQAYCFGINRTGTDGNGLVYLGDSAYITAKGQSEFLGKEEKVKTFEISYNELQNFREKFPLLKDRDIFNIQ